MEDSSQHLEHCAVDMRELSATLEGLAGGELSTLCPTVCRLICPRFFHVFPEITKYVFLLFKAISYT